MELHSENIAALDGAGEPQSVFASRRGFRHDGRMKRMGVVILKQKIIMKRTVIFLKYLK